MAARVIAIGDVHGCADALRAVLAGIEPGPEDTVISVGDCVDRGPDSRGVIELMLELRQRCQLVTLLGNHEEMMLNFLDGRPQPDDWLLCGGAETLKSYGADPQLQSLPAAHVDYIRTWIDYWENDSHFFVHANYDPDQPLSAQPFRLYRWLPLRESIPAPHCSGKTAIVGHTSQKDGEIFDIGYLKCIDTYCHGGGWLTALDVSSGQVWQADRNGQLRG